MDTLHFLEAKRHLKLDVGSGIGVVGKLLVVMIAVFLIAETKSLVPFQACLFPALEPLEFLSGAYEKLHFHLFELAHAEDKLTSHNLVAECFSYLCDTEGYAHAACLLHVKVVDEDTLCGLGTEIHGHRAVGGRAHLGAEHEVELTHLGPVLCAGNRVYDFLVDDNLAKLVEVTVIHRFCKTLVERVTLGFLLKDAGIGLAEKGFVKRVAETLAGFLNLFLDFVVKLRDGVLDKHVGAVTLL